MTLRLRQLQVVHRHGDRTPLRNVFKGSSATAEQEEHARWSHLLPQPEQLATLRTPCSVEMAPSVHAPMQTRPFGYLTTTGIDQMRARGDKLRALCEREAFALDALTNADVQVFSNAYTRTQLSAQALLSGLLRDASHVTPRVQVLAPDRDIINTYALFPEIAQLKLALESTDNELAERERAMAPRKRELLQLLPLFTHAPFTWMAAADYYVCRAVHNVPLVPGTEAHATAVIDHLSVRFDHFYSHARILQLVAGRLVQNILNEMQQTVDGAARKSLVVYSGHDISVLSVLHAIGAAPPRNAVWWPNYAAAVTLELLEHAHSSEWFVRARLDGTVLQQRSASNSVGTSESELLVPYRDFRARVTDLFSGFRTSVSTCL